MTLLSKGYALLGKAGALLQSPLLLVIRLFWGYQFFLSGKGKLLHLDKTAAYFDSLNIPLPKLNAIMASSTEFAGGILLLLGLFSRVSSLALMCVMCVALGTAHREVFATLFSKPDDLLGADPFLFLYAATLVFCFGPGRFAVDTLIFKQKKA